MKQTFVIFQRELVSYFATPLAFVFIVIFLVMAGVLTFYPGAFFERGQADLQAFFDFHPWLYLFFMPALSMRLWAEEQRSGSMELLMTLPISLPAAVLGKFLAAWVFSGLALSLTFPIVLTVNYLGNPDNGAILTGYLGSWLLAGGYLAIGSCMSAITRSHVIAFILSVALCFGFMVSGLPVVQKTLVWASPAAVDWLSSLSFLVRFAELGKGVIDLRDILYFLTLIWAWLAATQVLLRLKRSA